MGYFSVLLRLDDHACNYLKSFPDCELTDILIKIYIDFSRTEWLYLMLLHITDVKTLLDLSKLKKKSLWYINDTCSYFILIQIINKVPELMLNNISPHKHLIFYKKNTILVLL